MNVLFLKSLLYPSKTKAEMSFSVCVAVSYFELSWMGLGRLCSHVRFHNFVEAMGNNSLVNEL